MDRDQSLARPRWPGPLQVDTDFEEFLYLVLDPINEAWVWDDADLRTRLTSRLNLDQLSIWAIWNGDGQICNGGFVQLLYNSYGELAEEAVAGFRNFEMGAYADLLEEGFSTFERPVPIGRQERWQMLQRKLGVDPHDTAIYRAASDLLGPIESRYYSLRESQGDFLKLLCEKIVERKESFFIP